MKSLDQYDYLVVIVYMVMMVGIGVYFARFMKGSADYFKAGNRLVWWIGGLSAFMSTFSVYMFTGGAGIVYSEGLTGALWLAMTGPAVFTGYLLFAKLWRRSRVTTILEYLEERFNLPTHQVASWTYVFFVLLYSGTALYALGVFIAAALGIDVATVIVVAGLIIIAYTLLGGLWAVSVTDVVQFVVMFPICLLLIPLSLRAVGGFGELAAGSPEGYLSFPSKDLPWYMFAVSLLTLIHGQNTNPNAQRYFSASDEREARKVSLLCAVLAVVGVLFWAIPPMCARVLGVDLSGMQGLDAPREGAFVAMAFYVLPHGLLGLLIAAMFAATMSSLDSTYNVMSAVISKDLGQRVFDRTISDRHLLRLGQVVTLVIGLIVMSFSLVISRAGKGVFNTMLELGVLTGVPLAAPMLLGFLYRKAPSWAGLFTFICTGATALLFVPDWGVFGTYLMKPEHGGYAVWYTVTGLSQVGVAVVTFFISPLLFRDREPVRQRIAGFFKKLDTPVDVEKEIPPSTVDTRAVVRFIGVLALLLGGLVVALALIPGTARDRLINFGTGACILGFGLWLCQVGRRSRGGEGTEGPKKG